MLIFAFVYPPTPVDSRFYDGWQNRGAIKGGSIKTKHRTSIYYPPNILPVRINIEYLVYRSAAKLPTEYLIKNIWKPNLLTSIWFWKHLTHECPMLNKNPWHGKKGSGGGDEAHKKGWRSWENELNTCGERGET